MAMHSTGVSHIAVCVRDLDESLKFYRDILGMTVTVDRVQDTSTGGLPHVYAHNRSTRRQAVLSYGDGGVPTLVMTSHPGDDADGGPIKPGPGGHQPHFFFSFGRQSAGRRFDRCWRRAGRPHGRFHQRQR